MIYALLGIAAAFCAYIQWGDEIPIPNFDHDINKKEAKYTRLIKKPKKKNLKEQNLTEIQVVI